MPGHPGIEPERRHSLGPSACITTLAAMLASIKVSRSVSAAVGEVESTSAATTGSLFRYSSGQTLSETRRPFRLRQAARLLRHSGRSVQEIAAEVGFLCPFYFSRRFRQAFGVSPRGYRRQARGGS